MLKLLRPGDLLTVVDSMSLVTRGGYLYVVPSSSLMIKYSQQPPVGRVLLLVDVGSPDSIDRILTVLTQRGLYSMNYVWATEGRLVVSHREGDT